MHRCLGVDGVLSPQRIAAVIGECNADIVALQELDVRRKRSDLVDQAHAIAHELAMQSVHFHPAWQVLDELYGDAILTSMPSRLVRAAALPAVAPRIRHLEPRGAVWVSVEVGGVELQVINTHLGVGRRERRAQAAALLGEDWLMHPDCRPPFILTGDFNSLPAGRVYRGLSERLRDAHVLGSSGNVEPTFPSTRPVFRIDHVFVSSGLEPKGAQVWRSPTARLASDHLPLIADLRLETPDKPPVDRRAAARAESENARVI